MKENAEHNAVVDMAIGPGLTQAQAERIYEQGKEAVVFALLKQSQMLAEKNNLPAAIASDPSTPSGQKPAFVKPNGNRHKKPGRKAGHPGSRRQPPTRIDRTEDHIAPCCPDCGGALNRGTQTRKRIVEDIPETIRVETVEHVIHRDWCPTCQKRVEPAIPSALPKASICNGIGRLERLFAFFTGQHDIPDSGGIQLSPSIQDVARRTGADVASAGSDSGCVV